TMRPARRPRTFMTREIGMAARAAPTTLAVAERPLYDSLDRSAARSAPTVAPVATPTPPSICAPASTLTRRRWVDLTASDSIGLPTGLAVAEAVWERSDAVTRRRLGPGGYARRSDSARSGSMSGPPPSARRDGCPLGWIVAWGVGQGAMGNREWWIGGVRGP